MSPEAVHKLVGALLVAFVALSLTHQAGWLGGSWPRYILPGGLVTLGVLLILDPIVFHGGDFGAEGIQHQIQGGIIVIVGVVEMERVRGRLASRLFASLLPLTIVAVGVLFVLHRQHDGGDMALQVVQHRALGATIIVAGLVKAADSLALARGNWSSTGWLLLLLLASAQLFLYVEVPGVEASSTAPSAHGTH